MHLKLNFKTAIILLVLFCAIAGAQDTRQPEPAKATPYYRTMSPLVVANSWGSYSKSAGGLYYASDLAWAPDNTFYFMNKGSFDDWDRVQIFDRQGKYVNWFGGYGNPKPEEAKLTTPNALAIAPNMSIFVSLSFIYDIVEFTSTGKRLNFFDYHAEPYTYVNGMAVSPEGFLYATQDGFSGYVHKFKSNGKLIWTYPKSSTSAFSGMSPECVAVLKDGRIIVGDSGKHKLLVIDADGNLLKEWGSAGTGPQKTNYPREIVVCPAGYIYVMELQARYTYIQRWTENGQLVNVFTVPGNANDAYRKTLYQIMTIGLDGTIFLYETSIDNKYAKMLEIMPNRFYSKTDKGKISGKIKGLSKDAMQHVWVRIEGMEDGILFHGTVRPKNNGRFKFTKFPVGVDFTITLLGYDTTKYDCAPVTGTSEKKSKKNNLTVQKN